MSAAMGTTEEPDLVEAHGKSIRHRAAVSTATRCGCFQCLAQFEPGAIVRWTDGGETALCPRCRVDSVLVLEPGMDDGFLRRMKARWSRACASSPRGEAT